MNDYLSHSGVKGMSWGNRRYQNPDGTWTELGKERRRQGEGGGRSSSSAVSTYLKKRKEQRVAKREERAKHKEELEKQKAAEEEAKREEKRKAEKEEIESLKKEAIASGDVNKITKYAHLMTTEELGDAQKRAEYLDKILKSNTKLTKLDKIERMIKKGTSYAKTISEAKTTLDKLFPKTEVSKSEKNNPNMNKYDPNTKTSDASKKENKGLFGLLGKDEAKGAEKEAAKEAKKAAADYEVILGSKSLNRYSSDNFRKELTSHWIDTKVLDKKVTDVNTSWNETEDYIEPYKDFKIDDIFKKKKGS